MKNLILLILAAFLLQGCGGSGSSSSATATANFLPDPGGGGGDTSTDTPEVTEPVVSMSLLTANDVYLVKDEFEAQNSVDPKACGDKCFTDGDMKVFYDDYGAMAATESFDVSADHILDDWSIIDVSPDVAYANGALYKWYSAIYFQGVEQGHWSTNKWKTAEIIKTLSGDYIAIDDTKNYHPLSSVINNINYARELLIRDYDAANKQATIETDTQSVTVAWLTNYFNGAKDWMFLNGVWYSWNGYEFDGLLTENANAMWGFNIGDHPIVLPYGQYPTIIRAGTYNNALYWIECNKGVVYKYTPADDEILPLFGIYSGDGYKTTGLAMRDTIKPEIIGNELFVTLENAVNKINLDNGIVTLAFAGSGGEVTAW